MGNRSIGEKTTVVFRQFKEPLNLRAKCCEDNLEEAYSELFVQLQDNKNARFLLQLGYQPF